MAAALLPTEVEQQQGLGGGRLGQAASLAGSDQTGGVLQEEARPRGWEVGLVAAKVG